eukprot:1178777-Prorocentrum_minimum.AAC.1
MPLGQVGKEYGSVEEAIKAYEGVRQTPTAAIMQISRLNGERNDSYILLLGAPRDARLTAII